MGCCIAGLLIASQGLTLSARIRDFLRLRLGIAPVHFSRGVIAAAIGAELIILAALFQLEFGFAQQHAEHFATIARSANLLGKAVASEFPICSGAVALD